jgi:hypothetical protein
VISLAVGNKARGRVTVPDGYADCASDVPVKVQRKTAGKWTNVGSTRTEATGRYVVGGTSVPGRYRAIAKKVTLAGDHVCLKKVSPIARS